jgi:protocatechuate 3,4-dioxygenase beta subunit
MPQQPAQPVVDISVRLFGGSFGTLTSFADLELHSSVLGFGSAGWYDAWCLDEETSLTNLTLVNTNPNVLGADYAAEVYSIYDYPSVVLADFPMIENQFNLPAVNWLINQNFNAIGNPDGYRMSDVQAAIWILLDDDPNLSSTPVATSWNLARTTALVEAALEHTDFLPNINDADPTNDNIAVLISPFIDTNGDGVRDDGEEQQQPFFITVKSAALGDTVWLDDNADGIQNNGEVGVEGVSVTLWRDLDGSNSVDANEVIKTTTTDADGYYEFVGLTPGLTGYPGYRVQFSLPTDYVFTTQNAAGSTGATDSDANPADGTTAAVALDPGEFDQDTDAGIYKLASLGDKVWLDCNNNGIQDNGEAGVAGVTVQLLDSNGDPIASAVTGAQGDYLFSDLKPGEYAIQVVKPVGYAFTTPNAGDDELDSDVDSSGKSSVTVLTSGENDLSVDAGLVGDPVCVTYDFSGWSYTNGPDGNSRTYEMSGVSVTATAWSRQQDNGNWAKAYLGAYDGGLGVTDSSEGSGSYNRHTVDNRGGRDNYVVFQFSQDVIVDWAKLGYVVNDSDISVWIGSSDPSVPITNVNNAFLNSMTSFENNWTSSGSPRWANFNSDDVSGNVLIIAASIADRTPDDEFKIEKLKICTAVNCEPEQANASIGDRVWLDSNGNGLQDSNEAGVEGVTVHLLNGSGAYTGISTTTGVDGKYLFSNLTPGDYAIKVDKPADYSFTTKDVGNNGSDAKDSDVDTMTGTTDTTNLTAGENDLSWDAGLYKNPSIGDKVWLDCNNNGIQDAGEAGVAGVTVKLLDANGNGGVVATTMTNASGEYVFSGLTAGSSYAVQVVAPTGFAFAKQDQGGNDAKDSDVDTSTGKTGTITLSSGQNDISWDAGLVAKPICITYNFNGSSGTDGKDGNVRSYTESGVTVKASAWSREKGSTDKWAEAYLGAYSGGHGVTDSSEGSGGNNTHTVDNVGRDNFVVYQFSQEVVVDWAKLGYVVNDSDLSVWIGSYSEQIKIGNIKAALAQMSHYEEDWINNNGQARTADFNAGEKSGNVLIIAANISDTTPEDRFKITELKVCTTANCAPNPLKASVGDKVWEDKNHNNIQDNDEPGIGGITVNLMDASGTNVLDTTTTTSNGNYKFSDLDPGTYVLQFDKAEVVYRGYNMSNWKWAVKDAGSNDAVDSDVKGDAMAKTNVTKTDAFTLLAGQNDITRDAGITPIVIDLDGNGIQTVSRADSGGQLRPVRQWQRGAVGLDRGRRSFPGGRQER